MPNDSEKSKFWQTTKKWGLVGFMLFATVVFIIAAAAAAPALTIWGAAAAFGTLVAFKTMSIIEAVDSKPAKAHAAAG